MGLPAHHHRLQPLTRPVVASKTHLDEGAENHKKQVGFVTPGMAEPEGGEMKHSARVISIAMALAMTVAMGPKSLAQTQPANTGTQNKQQTQTQQQNNQQKNDHSKAKGAAAGAAIGAATTGNAAAGAVVGAGHSRREQRRNDRKQ
jgi:hypothetical protein